MDINTGIRPMRMRVRMGDARAPPTRTWGTMGKRCRVLRGVGAVCRVHGGGAAGTHVWACKPELREMMGYIAREHRLLESLDLRKA